MNTNTQTVDDSHLEQLKNLRRMYIALLADNARLRAALVQIADAAYGTDTPKLRARARAALAQSGKGE